MMRSVVFFAALVSLSFAAKTYEIISKYQEADCKGTLLQISGTEDSSCIEVDCYLNEAYGWYTKTECDDSWPDLPDDDEPYWYQLLYNDLGCVQADAYSVIATHESCTEGISTWEHIYCEDGFTMYADCDDDTCTTNCVETDQRNGCYNETLYDTSYFIQCEPPPIHGGATTLAFSLIGLLLLCSLTILF
ncbi:hypothetical protein Pelo_923 [Pelomyxa schiedti]|nr:hypothetical protein Pelo_923 [Pelomyxa schiedti]